ncbi:Retrovirus-related Pol polyprotein from transposon TNT 1-94 [Cardamine amara subsp. amara]|uniref:Retrovirus-related Pol polyprotein from transposon TNT 1-94 n=1 Tax=Cardamine amara subsp. amara TaxID=228776 RepID=A0ABD1C1S8_CARAN
MALVEAGKEALWLRGITSELGFPQKSVEIFCDSQSAICLAKNNVFHARTKHMAVRLNFIRDVIADGSLTVTKIGTLVNPADILTKSVPVKKFEEALSHLRVLRD